MMNEARVAVGLGAAPIGYRGYRHARERTQGQALDASLRKRVPVPIIAHPDASACCWRKRPMRGAQALALYCAKLVDDTRFDPEAKALLALLTSVAKTWSSEWGLVANQRYPAPLHRQPQLL